MQFKYHADNLRMINSYLIRVSSALLSDPGAAHDNIVTAELGTVRTRFIDKPR